MRSKLGRLAPFTAAVAIVAVVAVTLGTMVAAFASTATDQADYAPGSIVTISGDNTDGAAYLADETVHVVVSGPNDYSATCDGVVVVAEDGTLSWSCQITLNADESAVGGYAYTATGQTSGVEESGSFTDAACNLGALTGCHVKQSSLTLHQVTECTDVDGTVTAWHFVINPISTAPTSILVTWDDNSQATVPLSGVQGSNADYDIPGATSISPPYAGALIVDATVNVPSDNTGNIQFNLSHVTCETETVTPTATLSTEVHDASHANITNSTTPLGSVVHDLATVTQDVGTVASGSVTFTLHTGSLLCGGTAGTPETVNLGTDNAGDTVTSLQATTTPTVPLAAGQYSYSTTAHVVFTDGSTQDITTTDCEAFTVNKGTVTLSTVIHREPNEADIGTSVVDGSTVHDHAIISGANSNFAVNVSFTFFTGNTTCSGTGAASGSGSSTSNVQSSSQGPLSSSQAGGYAFQASVSNDPNYNDATSDCEPLTVSQSSLTKGYWGNKVGNAFLDNSPKNGTIDNGFVASIGGSNRGANVTKIDCSNAILAGDFKSLTGGTPTKCSGQNTSNISTLATGVTQAQVENLAGQDLALTYNKQYRTGFGALTLNGRGCAPVTFGGFSATVGATVAQLQAALAALSIDGTTTITSLLSKANALLNQTISGGTATQTQVEATTQLLGRCVNQEA
jgi:hypothetical protein